MLSTDVVRRHGRAAAEALLLDAEAIRSRELGRSRLRNNAGAIAEADALTRRLVESVLAPVVAYLLANDDRPEVVSRVCEVVNLGPLERS